MGLSESDRGGLCTLGAVSWGALSREPLLLVELCLLALEVAAVAGGFVAWGGQWGVQPFVITLIPDPFTTSAGWLPSPPTKA